MTGPAMILAAGFGTRMGALTADRPKPLIEVAGMALLDHAIAAAGRATPLVVNAHYRADQIVAHLAGRHPDILVSEETPEILDSGGGIKRALPMLDAGGGPLATLNADAVWRGPLPLDCLCEAWEGRRAMGALLLLVPQARAKGRRGGGDFAMDETGRLRWDKSSAGLVYTGAQMIASTPIATHRETVFSLRDIWQDMMDEGRLFGMVYPGYWADVGHPGGIAEAEAMLRNA